MIAFGGAAPLHAGRLCQKLGINKLLVPSGAGVGSAIGFLKAPFSFEASRSVYIRLSAFDEETISALLKDLTEEATSFVRSCDAEAPIEAAYKAFVRYIGQGWEIPVALTAAQVCSPTAEMLREEFEKEYAKLFGRTVSGLDIEVTSWSVNAATPATRTDGIEEVSGKELEPCFTRTLFEPALGTVVETSVIERNQFDAGNTAVGPLVITEDETTIIVPKGFSASLASDGTMVILKGEGA
jgi:N-methylhydantoinase A